MKVFNGSTQDGAGTGEVVLVLSKEEAKKLVSLVASATLLGINPSYTRTTKQFAKPFHKQLHASALCF